MVRLISLLTVLLLALPAQARPLEDVFDDVYRSVVVIETEQTSVPPFPHAKPVAIGGLGSGFVIDDAGHIMTAAHVVQAANDVIIHFYNGESARARVISSNPASDVALVKLERIPKHLHTAKLGDPADLRVGHEVFAVGAPLGISYTMTYGRVSGLRESTALTGADLPWELIQTDAAINQGNSGGPLFNADGEVVGIVSHIISQSGSSAGLGFAVSVHQAKHILLEQPPLWTGLDLHIVDGRLAAALNVPQRRAALVQAVAKNSVGEQLGVRGGTMHAEIDGVALVLGGDLLLGIDDVMLSSDDAESRIAKRFERLRPGDHIQLILLREGEVVHLTWIYTPPE